MNKYTTLTEALRDNARRTCGIHFLNSSQERDFLSYSELLAEASRCLAAYQAAGVRAGDELVLQFESSRAFAIGYWACLLGGIIPIPLSVGDNHDDALKVFAVWQVLEHPWMAADTEKLQGKLESYAVSPEQRMAFSEMSSRLIYPDRIDTGGRECVYPEIGPQTIAFIQFSSGSTGFPKGVVLTHENLLSNIYDTIHYLDVDETDSFLSWKPITHDFGMIAFHLLPVVAGVDQYRIPTNTFVWNPVIWMSAVNKYRPTVLGSPNFGYRHFLKRFKRETAQSEGWDLSCVKVIMNGAEPISAALCDEFTRTLGEWGLRESAISPGFGLAEGTLIVTLCPAAENEIITHTLDRTQIAAGRAVLFVRPDSANAVDFVDCGFPFAHTEVRITDGSGNALGEDVVGHIEIRGSSVTAGYYRNEETTRSLISPGGWLDTQDLGFMHNGRLTIVGRVKEMIIIGGINYFPHDIEKAILRSVGEDKLNQYVACGVYNPETGTEDLVIFVYFKKQADEFVPIIEHVRRLVLDAMGLNVVHVLPVKHVPKTTSGKIQRFKLVQELRDGKFDELIRRFEAAERQAQNAEEAAGEGTAIVGDAEAAKAPQDATAVKLADSEKAEAVAGAVGEKQAEEAAAIAGDIGAAKANAAAAEAAGVAEAAAAAGGFADAAQAPGTFTASVQAQPAETLMAPVREEVERLLGRSGIDADAGFFDIGLSSAKLLLLQERLEKRLGLELSTTAALDYPTIRSLAELLARTERESSQEAVRQAHESETLKLDDSGVIAVVGMACRFPGGADSPDAFWRLLSEGIDPVRDVPPSRWAGDPRAGARLTTRMGGYLDDVEQFDPLFFEISPTEAESLDPQQRLLLELTWEAFEDAGWDPKSLSGSRTGVFVGIAASDYAQVGRDMGLEPGPYTFMGTMLNSAAGRISYTFGLRGPCMAIDTACSSSLVAVHQGVLQLRTGGCDMAVAAGVNLILRAEAHESFSKLQALAPSGRCRSFDESADGYIRSEGGAVVVLKRLEDARRDGDRIWGLIRGAAVNHNGRSGGLTVPSGAAQQQVIRQALADAGLEPDDIDYVEAHGSGTKLGDPQEMNALGDVFAGRTRPLHVGSVKSNIGHLETAAGMASLLKVLLSMRHGTIPGNLHFRKGNPLIAWDKLRLEVSEQPKAWGLRGGTRRAGISSFGISGTNAHIVVEGAPAETVSAKDEAPSRDFHLFTLSARTEASLREYVRRMAEWSGSATAEVAELCGTLNAARAPLPRRLAIAVDSMETLAKRLANLADSPQPVGADAAEGRGPVVFLFTGQGSQYRNMARALYEQAPAFRAKLDELDERFRPHIGLSLTQLAYGAVEENLTRPLYAQPLIFSIEMALAHYWETLGVTPDIVIGHSIGEYAAACLAGIMELGDAVAMVAARAEVMDRTPAEGRMIGILESEAKVRELIGDFDDVSIAAVNAPENVTVSGGRTSVDEIVRRARKARIFIEELAVSHPFHSVLMREGAEKLKERIAGVVFRSASRRMISTVTGSFVPEGTDLDAGYWADHLVLPVRFADALQTAVQAGARLFLEIGGTATLCGLAAQNIAEDGMLFLPSLRENVPVWRQMLGSLGQLWQTGCPVNRKALHEGGAVRLADLPHTPYDRRRVWFTPPEKERVLPVAGAAPAKESSAGKLALAEVSAAVETAAQEAPVRDVADALRKMIEQVTGVAAEDIADTLNLFSLGLDSLMLVQLGKAVLNQFGVDIPIKIFFSDLHTVEKLAAYIAENGTFVRSAPSVEAAQPAAISGSSAPAVRPSQAAAASAIPAGVTEAAPAGIQGIVNRQLAIMEEQLRLLGSATAENKAESLFRPAPVRRDKPAPAAFRAAQTADTGEEEGLSERQKRFIADFIARWTARTKGSKEYSAQHKEGLADWIVTLNFSRSIKEMVYPLVSARSEGARFWDVDGNEYVDTAMGYGVAFFGHKPGFVTEAVREQLDKGFELGPQSNLVGEVTELIRTITGVERVAFCNTGTEAVMVALRLARAVSGRDKIVRFITSFHGSFDGVLADREGDESKPMSIGIPQSMVDDTVVLRYGSRESLEHIKSLGPELAAVLVEPVQSRNPGLQPGEYLRELRALCSQLGIALIFDEMVTGFRIHPGGAQAYFGVKADIVTYGKLIGGGMPIGVVAGDARYLDAVDGGSWSYGDDSLPSVPTTFFAGTFCKHPLTMAAMRAVLTRIRDEGPFWIDGVNARTERFVERANAYFAEAEVPLKTLRFGSMYRFETTVASDMAMLPMELNLFFRLMMEAGVYVWERRTCFFSTAHSDEDAEKILAALRYGVETLRAGGFSFRAAGSPTPPDRPEPCSFGLSSEEKRVYILSSLKGGSEAYQVRGVLNLSGRPDLEKLKRAFRTLAAKHEMLRSSFHIEGSEVVHRIADRIEPEFVYADMRSGDSAEEFEAKWQRPFDLAQAPLWRWGVLADGEGNCRLTLNFHHIIVDGSAVNILLKDLADAVRGVPLAETTLTYRAFVEEEKRFLAGPEAEAQRAWWLNLLRPLPASLQLPADAPRPPINEFAGASRFFTIGKEIVQRVKRLAKECRTTPFTVLLAAWSVLLSRISGQSDLVVGIPWDRRNNGNYERTVGMFAQTLPLRLHPEPSEPFAAYLETVKEICLGAYGHADYPLDALLRDLEVQRDLGRNPLFDVMFIYENGEQRAFELDGVHAEPGELPAGHAQFDLTLEMIERDGILYCSLNYAVPLFAQARMDDWIQRFKDLLEDAVDHPQQIVGELKLLRDDEERSLLALGSGPALNVEGLTAKSLLDGAFRSHAGSPAVWFRGAELSFAELDARAQALAGRLAAEGIGRGHVVGILLPRTPDLVAAILAAMKVGAAWLPLDPAFPQERLRYMIEKSEAKLLLCDSETRERLQPGIKAVDPADVAAGAAELEVPCRPDDLAYVIFTSGSTGLPKGVQIEQGALANFLAGMAQALDWRPGSRTACMSTASFDIFLLETLLCLSQGGCIVLAGDGETANPGAIAQLLSEGRVDCLQMTPTRLQLLLSDRSAAEALGQARTLIVGGEPFPAHLLPELQKVPSLRIFNVYGPTETCIWSTCKELTRSDEVTIGLPIANTQAYVLGVGRRLLPPGTEGDLWIGGAGVARGYAGAPELTAERFVRDPWTGGRMYATGDRAVWHGAELKCLGREDDQVKVRGYRIELGEIEQAVRSHPAVSQAAAAVKELSPGNSVLAAYYQPHDGGKVSADEMKVWLAKRLPDYMNPAFLVELAAIPQTANGKTDRKALPHPVPVTTAVSPEETDGVRHDVDRMLIRAWQAVLGDRPIGLHDSFFDIGGNSFSLVLMHAELEKTFPGVFTVADLFAYPTIVQLRQHVESSVSGSASEESLLPLPAAWAAGSGGDAGSVQLSASPELAEKLRKLGIAYGLELSEIVIAIFALYLNKTLNQDEIPLWMVGDAERVARLRLNMAGRTDLDEILRDVAASVPPLSEYRPLRSLKPFAASDAGMRVGFASGRGFDARRFLLRLDLILHVQEENERLQIAFEYGRRLDKGALESGLGRFAGLLGAVADKIDSSRLMATTN
ncbi:non-ribosomal peptide synthetase/type I polyketide synthase [Paenibacillus hamazuiensis]|uniref:non-ribosomal peptide synthetase/type I polyketide synthase n=1 Tax=Paenibacillus hamazuiensis TaxID=2936508 RepID=UPI00200C474A|nr:non-ribosomal peptide synthetase/type I polyketide synthase [Paenibacillus hamazuiensis]